MAGVDVYQPSHVADSRSFFVSTDHKRLHERDATSFERLAVHHRRTRRMPSVPM